MIYLQPLSYYYTKNLNKTNLFDESDKMLRRFFILLRSFFLSRTETVYLRSFFLSRTETVYLRSFFLSRTETVYLRSFFLSRIETVYLRSFFLSRIVPCAGRAFGPSPAWPAARGPGLYIISRAGPGLGLHTAGPGRTWAENNLNTSGLGRA